MPDMPMPPAPNHPLAVGVVVRKTVDLMTNRPMPAIGSVAVMHLPTVIATLAILPFMAPWIEHVQRTAGAGRTDPTEFFRPLLEALPVVLGAGAVLVVLGMLAYAIQIGAVMQVVFDAYRQQPSTLAGSLRAGVRNVPGLVLFKLLEMLTATTVTVSTFALPLVLAALASRGHASGGPWVVVIAFLFGGVGVVLGFVVMCLLSLGAGAIVADGLGPIAAFGRSISLVRASFLSVAATWLAVGCVYLLSLCLFGCFSGVLVLPVQAALGPIAGSATSQLVQAVPQVILTCMLHVVGAVLYGELTGVKPADATQQVVEVFR